MAAFAGFSDPPAAHPTQAKVVALHCSGSSGRQWRALQGAIGDGVLHAPDLIGSGGSAAWTGDRPFDLSEEAGPVLAQLRARGAPVHLVGHSYGGAVALHIALRAPSLVASIALYEPSAFFVLRNAEADARLAYSEIAGVASTCVTGLMTGDYAAAAQRFVAYWGGGEAWGRLKPEARRGMVASLPTLVLHFRALLGEATPLSAFETLSMPALILRGDCSPAPSRHVAELLASTIPGAERHVLAGFDHMAPLSRADEVASIIAAFQHRAEGAASRPVERAA